MRWRLAQENIALNGLADRVTATEGDVAAGFRALGLSSFDAVQANPPFFDDASALRGPHPSRKGAYIAPEGLAAWLDFLIKAVLKAGR